MTTTRITPNQRRESPEIPVLEITMRVLTEADGSRGTIFNASLCRECLLRFQPQLVEVLTEILGDIRRGPAMLVPPDPRSPDIN